MKKALIFALIAVSLICTMAVIGASASEAEPTLIFDKDGFLAMESGGSYKFANDIDMGGYVVQNYIFAEFSGVIDGAGFKIHNFSIVADNTSGSGADSGIIKVAHKNGDLTIKDLQLGTPEAPIVQTNVWTNHGLLIGAGKANSTNKLIIDNVVAYVDISADEKIEKCKYGGLIGLSQGADVEIKNCKVYGSVSAGKADSINATSEFLVGGLVGYANKPISFENCENHADILVHQSNERACAAGIIGRANTTVTLSSCKNFGNITCKDYEVYHENPMYRYMQSKSFAAGIIGNSEGSGAVITITDCDNSGDIFATNCVGSMIAFTGTKTSVVISGGSNSGKYTSNANNGGPIYGLLSAKDGGDIQYTVTVDEAGFINTGVGEDFVRVTYEEDLNTTEPSDETTTAPADDETTTAPADDVTTTAPADDVTTTKAPTVTTAPTDDAGKDEKGCGGIAGISAVLAMFVGVLGVAVIKKH